MAQIKISGLPAGVPNNDIEIPATNPNDLATPTGKTFKYYLTDLITFILNAQGFDTYSSCRVATTLPLTAVYANGAGGVGATLTNSGAQAPLAIDGVTLALGDRVLVKDQAVSAQNGIYFVSNVGSLATNWVLTRATDFDQGTEIIYLGVVAVNQGATNAGIIFQETSEGSFNIGTSAITFAPLQVSSVTQKQVQESAFNFAIAAGANNVFTANLLPDATAYTDGLLVTLSTGALTNTIGNPTLNVNGLGAKTITFNGLQLEPGDIEPNTTYVLVYDLNNDYFNIINPTISIANTRLIQYNEYNAATDTGVADAYIANITPPITSLTGFLTILCKITNANTGASTLTVNGQTAGIVTANNVALVGGELIANQVALFLYDATWGKFILVNPSNNVTTLLPVINHRLARFDGTSGRIQNSSATLADTGVLTLTADAVVNTVNIGLGGGSVATNTRVGVSALASNTTGARNVAEGYQALTTSTTANDVTAIGYQALTLNTVAYNTAVGSRTMDACTTGSGVALGVDSLGALTTGIQNTALGYSSAYLMTTTSYITAVGWLALANNTANYTTGLGWNAGQGNTSGSNNTYLGAAAGYSNATGSQNTYVGYSAGYYSTGTGNTALGSNALVAANNTASNNTAIGYLAMSAATSGTGVAVGKSALGALTTGISNVAIGTSASAALTTNNYTTAVGAGALQNNTASYNTAIGWQALLNNVGGYYNVAVGSSALQSNVSGIYLTAVGHGALASSTANDNTGIGWNAGTAVTSGNQNTYVGSQSGYTNITGANNTGLGKNALRDGTGSNNTAVGAGALVTMTTGAGNSVLGQAAGYSGAAGAVAISTGSYNTFLGFQSCANAGDATGTIGIGANAVPAKATGATSADDGPGIAIGSASYPVGFRGDGTIYPSAGTSAGYWRIKINGTFYKILLCADA